MHKTAVAPDHRAKVNTVSVSRRHSLGTKVQPFLRLACAIALGLVFAAPAAAQSLDEQLNFLLNGGCDTLFNSGSSLDEDSPLATICSYTSGSNLPGTSSGGNAASALQMAPSMIQDRLLDLRGGQTSAAMMMSTMANADGGGMGGGGEPDAATKAGAEAKSRATVKSSEGGIVTPLSKRLSLLISVEGETSDRDVTHFEDGYDSDILRFTAGLDSQFTDKFLAGVAFTYYDQDGDLHTGGDFENDSFGMLVYASIIPIERFFIQATVGYTSKDYKRTRVGSFQIPDVPIFTGRIKSKYDGNETNGGVLLGYDQHKGAVTFGPRASLDWIYTDLDGYSEKGDTGLELKFQDTSTFSLQSRLGVTGSTAVSTGFGVLAPQMYVNWVHEFENDQRTENFSFIEDNSSVQFQYQTEPPDRDFFELAVGVSAVLPNGWQTYAQYRTILGHDYMDSHVGALGMRVEF